MSAETNGRPLADALKSLLRPSQAIEYAVIDAFSDSAFGGNPAAVVPLEQWKDDKWLQSVAAEFNLSETAYIKKIEKRAQEGDAKEANGLEEIPDGEHDSKQVIHEYELRWFTPKTEVDLCGHATLASAYVLYHSGLVDKKDTIYFHSRSGILSTTCTVDSDESKKSLVELNFPWMTTTPSGTSDVQLVPKILGNVGIEAVGKASDYLIVELSSFKDLEALQPNVQPLLDSSSDGLIATTRGPQDSGYDFISRCFFPDYGVTEDPVTGMAHTILGPYWSTKLGKNRMQARQASVRGGTLEVEVDKKIGRVYLRGQATLVMSGVLLQ